MGNTKFALKEKNLSLRQYKDELSKNTLIQNQSIAETEMQAPDQDGSKLETGSETKIDKVKLKPVIKVSQN